jgi:predicted MFS family arabinose efflux permease
MAGVRVVTTLAALATAPIAGAILDAVGHGPPFAVAGALGALSALVFARLRVLRPRVAARPPPWRLVQTAWRNQSFRSFTIAYTVHGVGGLLMFLVIPIVLVDDFDAPFITVGALALAQGLASVVGFSLWGRLSDRYSGPVASVSSNSLSVVSGGLLIVAIITGSLWLVAVAFVVRGLQVAGYDIGWLTSVTAMAQPEQTSALTTTFLVTIGIRGLIVPFVGTALIEAMGSMGTLAVTIGIVAVSSGLMVRVARGFVPVPDDPETA